MEVQDREEFQLLANTLNELENLTDRLIKNQTALRMFSKMSKIFIHNLNCSLLSTAGEEAAIRYKQLYEGVSIYKKWIQYTLTLVKPISIHTPQIHHEL